MAGVAFAVEGDGVGFATESYAASALYTTLASLSGALWRIRRARLSRYMRELRERCERLGEFPKSFPLVPRYESSGVRRRVHGEYLIFYRVGIETIDVLHVLHGATDYEPVLFPEG